MSVKLANRARNQSAARRGEGHYGLLKRSQFGPDVSVCDRDVLEEASSKRLEGEDDEFGDRDLFPKQKRILLDLGGKEVELYVQSRSRHIPGCFCFFGLWKLD